MKFLARTYLAVLLGLGLLFLYQPSLAQDTLILKGDTIRVGELEWDMEKDKESRGIRFSQNKDLYGDNVYIFFSYHPNKEVEQIVFGYLEEDLFVSHGPARYYYDSGHLLSKRYFLEGVLQGKATDFYKNGKKLMATTFIDGQLQGNFTSWYPDGKADQTGFYLDDRVFGLFKSYYNNEKLKWIEFYDSTGTKQGTDSTFYETGKLESSFSFVDGLEDGPAAFWHRNGKLWSRRDYLNGILVEVEFIRDKNGRELEIGTYTKGKGYLNVYNDDGVLIEREHYKAGKLRKVKAVKK